MNFRNHIRAGGRSLAVGLLAMLASVSASAEQLIANVPFDFNVGQTAFQAGRYTIEPGGFTNSMFIRGYGQATFTFVNPTRTKSSQGRHVFRKYGETYFLAEILHPRYERGWQTLPSKAEREMSRTARSTGLVLAFVPLP